MRGVQREGERVCRCAIASSSNLSLGSRWRFGWWRTSVAAGDGISVRSDGSGGEEFWMVVM